MSEPLKKISICTTVKNRHKALIRLLRICTTLHEATPLEVIVVDQGSIDAKLNEQLCNKSDIDVIYSHVLNRFFNRSMGLNKAATLSTGSGDDILYFTDVDMDMPADYLTTMRRIVIPGTCWFPVCYSLHRGKPREVSGNSKNGHNNAYGWWRHEGKGMCGFTHNDYHATGRWDERVGQTYGGEDGDIARRSVKSLTMVRERTEGLFHVWHPLQRTSYRPATPKRASRVTKSRNRRK